MEGRLPIAALLFAAVVVALALVDAALSGHLGTEAWALLAGGAVPLLAFLLMGLAVRRGPRTV